MSTHKPERDAVESTLNLWVFLTTSCDASGKITKELMAACKTQLSLAQYKNQAKGIKSLSLNTLKSSGDYAIEKGGWCALDELRKNIYKRALVESCKSLSKRRSISETLELTQKKLEESETKIQNILRERAVLISAYYNILTIIHESECLTSELSNTLKMHEMTFNVRNLTSARDNNA